MGCECPGPGVDKNQGEYLSQGEGAMATRASRLAVLVVLVLIVAVVIAGCGRIITLEGPTVIAVPDDLASDEVGMIVRRAIIDTDSGDYRGRVWTVEEDQPGKLMIGHRSQNHYLRLAVDYDQSQLEMRIVDAENMHFSTYRGSRLIHRSALTWREELQDHLRRALYRESFEQRDN